MVLYTYAVNYNYSYRIAVIKTVYIVYRSSESRRVIEDHCSDVTRVAVNALDYSEVTRVNAQGQGLQ